ncbi:hypothetical protein GEMRC1_003464 [Eukaryota sp. GEM-RC1]
MSEQSSLFIVDTRTASDIAASRKRLHQDLVLAGDPSVIPVVKKPVKKHTDELSKSDEAFFKRQINAIKSDQQSQPKPSKTTAVQDIWNSPPSNPSNQPRTLNSTAKSVPAPNPGQSYNPDQQQHKELLDTAVAQAVVDDDSEKYTFSRIPRNAGVLSGMPVEEAAHYPGPVKVTTATSISRRSKRNQKAEEPVETPTVKAQTTSNAKSNNKKKALASATAVNQAQLDADKNQRKEGHLISQFISQAEEKKFNTMTADHTRQVGEFPSRLGPVKYQEPLPDVLTVDELPSKFSSLPLETSVVEDRYTSILRRGLVEPRKKQYKRNKYPIKMKSRGYHFSDVIRGVGKEFKE